MSNKNAKKHTPVFSCGAAVVPANPAEPQPIDRVVNAAKTAWNKWVSHKAA